MFCSCFVVTVVLCIFIFVCTSVGLLPPGESPIAVSSSSSSNNNNNSVPPLGLYGLFYGELSVLSVYTLSRDCGRMRGIILFYLSPLLNKDEVGCDVTVGASAAEVQGFILFLLPFFLGIKRPVLFTSAARACNLSSS